VTKREMIVGGLKRDVERMRGAMQWRTDGGGVANCCGLVKILMLSVTHL